jgi:hypothetical protein
MNKPSPSLNVHNVDNRAGCGTDEITYQAWMGRIQNRFSNLAKTEPLFAVNLSSSQSLFDIYLSGFTDEHRQYHTCHACRHFINRFGNLATVDKETGALASVMWDVYEAPDAYKQSVFNMAAAVENGTIDTVFIASEAQWGTPVTGPWTHFAVQAPHSIRHDSRLLTAGQKMAERRQDFGNVMRGLAEFDAKVVEKALALLQSETMYQAEKVIGPVAWLHGLHTTMATVKGRARQHLAWRAIATAPAGFCHPRSSMAGTLLEDLQAGMPMEAVTKRFAAKMHPLAYQRPQAAPTEGNIKRGEEIIEKLGLTLSLKRRFARPEDVTHTLWKPVVEAPAHTGGVFGHLKAKGAVESSEMTLPEVTMTWDKFARTVLPEALGIELELPAIGNYCALTTAVVPEAPPILQWDVEGNRNPVAWYVWDGGSSPTQWGLGHYVRHVKVWAITPKPSEWTMELPHQGKGIVLLLEGAKESRFHSMALFPSTLRSELHEVRATIEAFSKAGTLDNKEGPHAAGLLLHAGAGTWNAKLRVKTKLGTKLIKLDRWD